MVGHGGSSAGSYLADPTSPIPSHCASIVVTSTLRVNFGEDFQKWVKLLYSKPCVFIKNNGFFSDTFSIFRGVRQGCSLSSLMFILCMEVLSQHINQNNKIKGLSIDKENNQNVKVVQYADDTTFFSKKYT